MLFILTELSIGPHATDNGPSRCSGQNSLPTIVVRLYWRTAPQAANDNSKRQIKLHCRCITGQHTNDPQHMRRPWWFFFLSFLLFICHLFCMCFAGTTRVPHTQSAAYSRFADTPRSSPCAPLASSAPGRRPSRSRPAQAHARC